MSLTESGLFKFSGVADVTHTTAATFNSTAIDLGQKDKNLVTLKGVLRLISGSAVGSNVTVNWALETSEDNTNWDGVAGTLFDVPGSLMDTSGNFIITDAVAAEPAMYNFEIRNIKRYIRLRTIVAGGSTSRSVRYEAYLSMGRHTR
jgi:hypothetical protein